MTEKAVGEAGAPQMAKPATAASAWGRIAVIYVGLALGALAFPGGLVDWLDERNGDGWFAGPLIIAHALDEVSAALGVKGVGQALRRNFAAWVGEDAS